MAIGKNLRKILSDKNMTVKELSRKTGITASTLYAIIQRDNLTIKPDIAQKICEVLEIDESTLINPQKAQITKEVFVQHQWNDNSKFSILELLNAASLTHNYDDNLNKLIHCYTNELNDLGRQEAAKRIEELTQIPKYTTNTDNQNNSDQQN